MAQVKALASPIMIVQYPIAVGPGGLVVNGHARLAAARNCGVDEVAVVQVLAPNIQMDREAC
jgi:ParB-like chromosome segregation protein Spo0J